MENSAAFVTPVSIEKYRYVVTKCSLRTVFFFKEFSVISLGIFVLFSNRCHVVDRLTVHDYVKRAIFKARFLRATEVS